MKVRIKRLEASLKPGSPEWALVHAADQRREARQAEQRIEARWRRILRAWLETAIKDAGWDIDEIGESIAERMSMPGLWHLDTIAHDESLLEGETEEQMVEQNDIDYEVFERWCQATGRDLQKERRQSARQFCDNMESLEKELKEAGVDLWAYVRES